MITVKNETRNIETVEAELSNAQAAKQRIIQERQELAEDLESAVAREAQSTEEAVRAGQAPKASRKVAQIEARISELKRHRTAIEPLVLKLQAERTRLLLAQAEAEQTEKNDIAEAKLAEYRAADEALQQAQSEAAWARENRLALREQLVNFRRRLAEMGVEEPTDRAEREANQAEAEKIRHQAEQWQPTMPIA